MDLGDVCAVYVICPVHCPEKNSELQSSIKYVIYYNILYFFPQVPVKGSSIETNNVFLIIDYPGILTGHNNDL